MSDRSAIEWTDATWNPVRAHRLSGQLAQAVKHGLGWHCEHVSEGCRNCYAEAINGRLGTGLDYKPGHRKDIALSVDQRMLLRPLQWKKPRKIFAGSMTDLFADFVTDEMLDPIFAVVALTPQHIYQFLTKRPARMRSYFRGEGLSEWDSRLQRIQDAAYRIAATQGGDWNEDAGMAARQACVDNLKRISDRENAGFRNVWLGVSVEDQAAAGERIPILLDTPAAIRWLSCEPLLGPVDLSKLRIGHDLLPRWATRDDGWAVEPLTGRLAPIIDTGPAEWSLDGGGSTWAKIDWVVAGGESGRDARPMHPDWARSLRDQCDDAGVAFLFKQWGEYRPCTDAEMKQACGATLVGDPFTGSYMMRVGKKRAGRLLDGVQHDGYPA